jgi:hypothetical protein
MSLLCAMDNGSSREPLGESSRGPSVPPSEDPLRTAAAPERRLLEIHAALI